MFKYIEIIRKFISVLTFGKINTRDDLTSFVGLLIGLICLILNQVYGINIPEDLQLTFLGLLVALILFCWKPFKEIKPKETGRFVGYKIKEIPKK